MKVMQTTVASIGRLGLAAATRSPVLARTSEPPGVAGRPAMTTATSDRFGTSNLYELLLHATIATGWLSERRTLHGRSLARDAKIMVTVKDVLVAGTVLTGAATLVGKAVTRREPPADQLISEEEQPSSDAVIDADGHRRYLRTMMALNRTFAFFGVAATPFINFALFDSYHPHPVRSFFSLW